jgi:hypothetical protein
MLENDVKAFREKLILKHENAESLELQWEAKAYLDCLNMFNELLKENGLLK